MNEIKTHIDVLDTLSNIHDDIKALAHIAMFLGIGSKECQVREQELWFLCDALEKLAKQTQACECYLQKQREIHSNN